MSRNAPGAEKCPFCNSDNTIVQMANKSVMCVDCCCTGPTAMAIEEFNGRTHPAEIAIAMWNIRDGSLIVP